MERYAQQIQLEGFGLEKQKALQEGKVLVVGAGGLGCAVLQTLTAMGVGTIGVADGDVVAASNLHRQILYTPEDLGQPKSFVAKRRLTKQNPDIQVDIYGEISQANAPAIFSPYQVIVDASDNFSTRYLVNDVCVQLNLPFVSGGVEKFSGHLSTFNWRASPTYRDLFPTPPDCCSCKEGGVLGVIPNLIGQLQALEVVKLLTGIGRPLAGELLCFDAGTFKTLNYTKQTQSFVREIRAEQLSSLGLYQLVDVRTLEEREHFHIGGLHLPDVESSLLNQLDPKKPIVVYCRSGKRSLRAAFLIQNKLNAHEVYSLEKGIIDMME